METERTFGYKNSAPITPPGMYFPSTLLPSPQSFLLSEKDMVGRCYTGRIERESKGKMANPGSPGKMAVTSACVYD